MGKQLTYQELLAAYNKLLKENEFLHKEVDRLQALLSNKDIPMEQQTIKQHLSLDEKVDVFRNLFKGREDVFARRWYSKTNGKSGYQPVCRNEWDRQSYAIRKNISVRNALQTTPAIICVRISMTSLANMDIRKMCWHMSGSVKIGIFLVPSNAPAPETVHMYGYSLNSH